MLKDIADRLKDKKKVILVHGNADMDAISSAYVLSKCFPPADICALNGVDRVAKMVSEKLGLAVLETFDPDDYDLIVTVDTSSPCAFHLAFRALPCAFFEARSRIS